jgi:hypothetical protein
MAKINYDTFNFKNRDIDKFASNDPIVRKNLLGRDVKITTEGNTKTREVTGENIAKTKVTKELKSGGSKVTTSTLKVSPREQMIDVTNKTKYTGEAARKRVLDVNPETSRTKTTSKAFSVDPAKAKETKNTLSVREKAKKTYKGSNLPRNYND